MIMKPLFLLWICLVAAGCAVHHDGPTTAVNDRAAATKLKGDHDFSLQWISWDDFGVVSVSEESGLWRIRGRQDSRANDDFITIDGAITEISRFEFKFDGEIVTQIHHIANGQAVTRTGPRTFRITGKRQYWRMMEMQNPRDSVVDYVDVFFRRPKWRDGLHCKR